MRLSLAAGSKGRNFHATLVLQGGRLLEKGSWGSVAVTETRFRGPHGGTKFGGNFWRAAFSELAQHHRGTLLRGQCQGCVTEPGTREQRVELLDTVFGTAALPSRLTGSTAAASHSW